MSTLASHPSAETLKALKATDPVRYREELAEIERRRLGGDQRAHHHTPGAAGDATPYGRATGTEDQLVEHLRMAYGLDDGSVSQLRRIRRSVIYACVTLRADMLSGLPLKVYRIGGGQGRAVDVRDPLARLGMPTTVRGRRIATAPSVVELADHPLVGILERPNLDWTGRGLIRMTEVGLGLAGQAHWRLHGRGTKLTQPPAGLSWLKHSRLAPIKPGDSDAIPAPPGQVRSIAGWWLDRRSATEEKLDPREVLWMRYVDPDDPDYGVLAPSDIARLGADSYQEAMQSNRNTFRRGLKASALVMPPKDTGQEFESDEQLSELERELNRKLYDPRAENRIAALKYRLDIQALDGISPKDAEFVALMEFAIEDAARTYRVPIEFVGGVRRTYQNMDAAFKGIWMMALEPQASWIADELTVKLANAWGDDLFVGFDLSEVTSLQEDEAERWRREREQIEVDVLARNEWRESHGMEALPTASASIEVGKVGAIFAGLSAMGQGLITPESLEAVLTGAIGLSPEIASAIVGSGPPESPPPVAELAPPTTTAAAIEGLLRRALRDPDIPQTPAYDSDEHRAVMERRATKLGPLETRTAATVRRLMQAQRESLAAKLTRRSTADHGRAVTEQDLRTAYNRPEWVRKFREGILPDEREAYRAGGEQVLDDLGVDAAPDVTGKPAVNFLRGRAQRFAEEVTETTWMKLKDSFVEGIDAGETMKELAARVDEVMGDRIRSSPEVIARTEVLGAFSGGSQQAAEGTGLDLWKTWMSALDRRVRDDHRDVHGVTVALDEDFDVGDCSGPGPGLTGCPEQDIQCRCTVIYEEKSGRVASAGGAHVHAVEPR